MPAAFDPLPAALRDLNPVHELAHGLPAGAATTLAEVGVRRVPPRRADMRPNRWADKLARRQHRPRIEPTTTAGFELQLHASLLALLCSNGH